MKKIYTGFAVAMSILSLGAAETVLLEQDCEKAAVNESLKETYFTWGKKDGTKLIVTNQVACSGKQSLMLVGEKGSKGPASYGFKLPVGIAGKKKTLTFSFMAEDNQLVSWQIITNTTNSALWLSVDKGVFKLRGKTRAEFGKIIEAKTWYTVKLEMPDDGKSQVTCTVTQKETGDAVTKQAEPELTSLKPSTYLRMYANRSDKEDWKLYMDDFRYTEE